MVNLQNHAKKSRKNHLGIIDDLIYRWSPRNMTGQSVKDSQLNPLFEAARWAPSSSNNQEWTFYFAHRNTDKFTDLFNLLAPGNQTWCTNAGVLMILVSSKLADYKNKPIPTHSLDSGAAWISMAVEGTKRNLVVHAMSGIDFKAAHKYLNLTDRYQVECMIAIGHPSPKINQEPISQRNPTTDFAIDLSK